MGLVFGFAGFWCGFGVSGLGACVRGFCVGLGLGVSGSECLGLSI